MNLSQEKYQWLPFLLIIVLMTFIQKSFATEMDCKIGNKLARTIYDRTAIAKNQHNIEVAFANKDNFWDVYQYSSHCSKVIIVADKLNSIGMNKDARPPTTNRKIELPEVFSACMNSPECSLTIIEEGSGSSTSMEGQKIYQISGVKPGGTLRWDKVVKNIEPAHMPLYDELRQRIIDMNQQQD